MTDGFRSAADTAWRAGVDFVYERACPRCRCELPDAAAVDRAWPRLCVGCAGEVAPPVEFACVCCGAPVGPHLETSGGCVYCRDDRFAFERAVALGVYDDALRLACLSIKKGGAEPLAAALGHLLWRQAGDELRRLEPDVVVAVPHHWIVRISRGHNPAATIARVLAARLRRPFVPGLRKVRHTPSQTSLTPTERRANLRGAFRAGRGRRLAGRRVLLVDDVLTTGTTAHRAARALLKGGAAAVAVAVIARGIGRGTT